MIRLQKILREPLLHFLVLGAGLFVLFGVVGKPADEPPDRVVVTEAKIANLAELFERTWRRPPTRAELDGLIADHIKEEILYREALALGLDADDAVIRRRLRQKMEFISEDVAAQAEPTEDELQTFLAEHRDRFRTPPRISFAQVYLSPDRRGQDTERDAERLLASLSTGEADAADAGDPFLMEHEFRNLAPYDVERLFGRPFAERLAELPVGSWSGPVESPYGLHLIMVRERTEGGLPELDEVRDAVALEWRAVQRQAVNETFYEGLRQRYDVTIERPPGTEGAAAAVVER
jgi:PPIC-type PPIASE domain